MNIQKSSLNDAFIIEPDVFEDERGFFMESFSTDWYSTVFKKEIPFFQDNHSCSKKNVLRGLHYQKKPFAQGKLVRVLNGEVFDVIVDLRKNSSTFLKWFSVLLSSENKKILWIPEGFAHGFLALTNKVDFLYKTSGKYDKNSEMTIVWNDPTLNISWPDLSDINISKKDKNGVFLSDIDDDDLF